jgi:hypothetical protein
MWSYRKAVEEFFGHMVCGTTTKPGSMRHVLHAWMESGSLHARLSCIHEDNFVFVKTVPRRVHKTDGSQCTAIL